MATATQPITIEEYLHTRYEPDCDYVDGEVQERNLGELTHAEVQARLAQWFLNNAEEWTLRVGIELRIWVAPTRVRIADVALLSRSEPVEQVPTRPPLAVIEIISPEDRFSRYEQRIDDYRNMDIRHIWVIDPQTRRGFDCSSGSWIETASFAIENSPIRVDLSIILAEL
ncbi:MAG TPA: Uma2 family endonuclease [Terriglobales bacterium]|nr:Uma2 family endonuclease [Terriglobales bacterium]